MKNKIMYVVIGILVVSQIYSTIKINDLQNWLIYLEGAIQSTEAKVNNTANNLYQYVDTKIEDENSLLNSFDFTIGDLDSNTLLLPITFNVVPKEITETMTVFVDINGESKELQKRGVSYTLTENYGIKDDLQVSVVIEDDGIQHIEEQYTLANYEIFNLVFSRLEVNFEVGMQHDKWSYRYDGDVRAYYSVYEENNPFVEVNYVVKINDEVVETIPILNESPIPYEQDGNYYGVLTNLKREYSTTDNPIIKNYVIAKDKLGFTHEYLLSTYDNENGAEYIYDSVKIYAEDGSTIIYEDTY